MAHDAAPAAMAAMALHMATLKRMEFLNLISHQDVQEILHDATLALETARGANPSLHGVVDETISLLSAGLPD